MSSFERCEDRARDPVELLLRRIVDSALLGSLVTSTALGCSDGDKNQQSMDPSTAVDSGGFLFPEPIPTRDAALDARLPAVMDATVVEDAGSVDALVDAALVSELPPDAVDLCQRGAGFPVRAAGLTLATPADYVAVRLATGIQGAPDDVDSWTSDNFTVISETGSKCATASDASCAQKVAHHPEWLEQSYCVQACNEWSIVTTRGNDVERWASVPELLGLLGGIDTDDDALMIAGANGYDVTCAAPGASLNGASLRYVRTTPAGRELIGVRYGSTCPVVIQRVRLLVTPAGEVQELDSVNFTGGETGCVGRVPAGLHPTAVQGGLAGYLARCAHLEAASVYAFDRLAEELHAHGAPTALVSRARAAARDEVRHAQTMGALARAHGASLPELQVDTLPVRSLQAIALENAVEGCVRETYGALVGAFQAARASDLELRVAMRSIAADEARHAQLSHDVHTWLMTQLDAAQRAEVMAAQRDAIGTLPCSCEQPAAAGLPNAREARELQDALRQTLWAA